MTSDKLPIFVPPRPNPGPEPPTAEASRAWLLWMACAALLLAFLLVRTTLARRRRQNVEATDRTDQDSEASAHDRLIRCADRLREFLIERFGPEYRAKTTEELEASPMLVEAMGPESAARLLRILKAADRAKFAAPGATDGEEWERYRPDWEAWLAESRTEAGASSKTTGR